MNTVTNIIDSLGTLLDASGIIPTVTSLTVVVGILLLYLALVAAGGLVLIWAIKTAWFLV